MNYRLLIALLILSMSIGITANAQITNLTVNGASSNFIMESGGLLSWEMNIPSGTSVTGNIWVDVNNNGTIDPATDIKYVSFTETDGDTVGNQGPTDMDNTVNGHLIFSIKLGIAPAKYIMQFTQNSSVASVAGTITAMTTVAHSISGKVTAPSGHSAQWILIEARPQNGNENKNMFWDALTDANGNYIINMDADTSGNPWEVSIQANGGNNNNPFPPYIMTPSQYTITISAASYTLIDFNFVSPAAQLGGYLKDENGTAIQDAMICLERQNMFISNDTRYYATTDNTGYFLLGIAANDLNGSSWMLYEPTQDRDQCSPHVLPMVNIGVVSSGNILNHNLTGYLNNSTISGTVTVDGHAPGFTAQIYANTESTRSFGTCDPVSGAFSIPVTNKISSYYVNINNVPGNYYFPNTVLGSPGQTGIVIALTSLGVREVPSLHPASFSLVQNYPNPFNPTTNIRFSLPYRSVVTLIVYDVLGRTIATLADKKELESGVKEAQFDGSGIPSGIYIYRLTAVSIADPTKNFSQSRKMLLVK